MHRQPRQRLFLESIEAIVRADPEDAAPVLEERADIARRRTLGPRFTDETAILKADDAGRGADEDVPIAVLEQGEREIGRQSLRRTVAGEAAVSRQRTPPPYVAIQRRPRRSSRIALIQLFVNAGELLFWKMTERTPSKRASPSTVPTQR